MAEYVLARLAHGTTRGEITAVEQFLEHAGVLAWEAGPAHADHGRVDHDVQAGPIHHGR